jgi:hypothetical protein
VGIPFKGRKKVHVPPEHNYVLPHIDVCNIGATQSSLLFPNMMRKGVGISFVLNWFLKSRLFLINKIEFYFIRSSIHQAPNLFPNTIMTQHQANQNQTPRLSLNQYCVKGLNWGKKSLSYQKQLYKNTMYC